MQKKQDADWVFFNVDIVDSTDDAVAIYQGVIIDFGSIPYIFSNYRGFQDYNAQGFQIGFPSKSKLMVGDIAHQLAVYKGNYLKNNLIWQIEGENCIELNTDLLDPNWDDH